MEKLKTQSIVVILLDDGITPLQSISSDNFVGYKYIDNNKLEVVVNTIEFPNKHHQETSIQFNISPHNNHVLRAIKNW